MSDAQELVAGRCISLGSPYRAGPLTRGEAIALSCPLPASPSLGFRRHSRRIWEGRATRWYADTSAGPEEHRGRPGGRAGCAERRATRSRFKALGFAPGLKPLLRESAEAVRPDPRGFGEVLLTVLININGFIEIWSVEISGQSLPHPLYVAPSFGVLGLPGTFPIGSTQLGGFSGSD